MSCQYNQTEGSKNPKKVWQLQWTAPFLMTLPLAQIVSFLTTFMCTNPTETLNKIINDFLRFVRLEFVLHWTQITHLKLTWQKPDLVRHYRSLGANGGSRFSTSSCVDFGQHMLIWELARGEQSTWGRPSVNYKQWDVLHICFFLYSKPLKVVLSLLQHLSQCAILTSQHATTNKLIHKTMTLNPHIKAFLKDIHISMTVSIYCM